MSKLIDLSPEDNPFIRQPAANPLTVAAQSSESRNHLEYYIDSDFFAVDAVKAEEYNRRMSELVQYTVYAETYLDLTDQHQRMRTFAALSYALRKAGEAEAWASMFYNTARASRKEAEAVAALDDFADYLTKRAAEGSDLKATDKNREWFIQQSPRVMNAAKREAMAEAFQKSFWIMRLQFTQALSTLKAFSYGVNDANMLSTMDHK